MREAIYGDGLRRDEMCSAERRGGRRKCKPVVDELLSVKGRGVSQLCVGLLGWPAFLRPSY